MTTPSKGLTFVLVLTATIILSDTMKAAPGRWIWATRVASTVNDDDELTIGLAIDIAGNLYVTGWFDGTNDFGNGVLLTNRTGGGQDIFAAKYNNAGVAQWTASSSGGDGAIVFGPVVVDGNGYGYVAGWFRREVVFGETTLTGTGTWDFFLAKVSGDYLGLSIEWINSQPRLTISGDPGSRFALDFASAVAAMNSYQPLTTNTLATSPMMLLDPSSVGHPTRFYRVRLVP